MASFQVNKINFSGTPSGDQTGTLEYKEASSSGGYTLVSSDVDVDTDGTVLESPPLTISGLVSGTLYILRFSNNCASPVEYWYEYITAP